MAMKSFLMAQMDAMLENPGSDVSICGKNGESVLYATTEQQPILIKYIKMVCNGDKKAEESEMRKLKPTTFLLHVNDVMFIGREYFQDIVLEHDLSLNDYGYTPLTFSCPSEMLSTDMRHCEQCNQMGQKRELLKCGRCKMVYYCNGDCQRTDWPSHNFLCNGICKEMRNEVIFLHKSSLAWRMVLTSTSDESGKESRVHRYFDAIEEKCGKKSKVLLLMDIYGNSDNDRTSFEFRTVSFKFFTKHSKRIISNAQLKKNLVYLSEIIKSRPDAFLLAIPFDGDFAFHMF